MKIKTSFLKKKWLKKLFKKQVLFLAFSLLIFSIFTFSTSAQTNSNMSNSLNQVANAAGVKNQNADLVTIIGRIINIALSFVGILLLVILLYSGYEYMTAGGDSKKVESAQTRIKNAVIGLLIIMASFGIVNFILSKLTNNTGGGFWGGVGVWNQSGGGFGSWGSSGSLGNGLIQYHYPERDQKDVPRNTAIAITFKEAMDPRSFIKDWDSSNPDNTFELNSDLVEIYSQSNSDAKLLNDQARVTFSEDHKTVVIKPNKPLGNATSKVWYNVHLIGGSDGIKLADGTPAFSGSFDSGYLWSFEVSTKIDLTPPHVLSRIPYSVGTYDRNIVIQINFNEPVLPISASGRYQKGASNSFTNITIKNSTSNELVEGEFRISNGYRTVEFMPIDHCGKNSCGMDMYCLPQKANIKVLAKAATLSDEPPIAAEMGAFGFDGVVDMAGNSLDGNNNHTAEGPGNDDFAPDFTFTTTDQVRLDGSKIIKIEPHVLEGEVPVDQKINITWEEDNLLLSSSINSDNVYITRHGPGENQLDDDQWWFYSKIQTLNKQGVELQDGEKPAFTKLIINHRHFLPTEAPKKSQTLWQSLNLYAPHVEHTVLNIYQNCFSPAKSELTPGDEKIGTNNLCNNESSNQKCETLSNWKQ